MSQVQQLPVTEKNARDEGKSRRLNRRGVISVACVCIGLLGAYASGVFLRWSVVGCLRDYYGELPYTLEGALLFHYAEGLAETGSIPALDERAQVPEGLEVPRKLSIGKEIPAAALYAALGRPGAFREFVRHFDAAWFCLGIFAVFALIWEMRGGPVGGSLAAALYAVSVPSVIRSTGLEFSRENFALPLIFLHCWLLVRGTKRRTISFSVIPAGLLLAAAAATWDVTQLYILLLGMFAVVRLFFGKDRYLFVRAFLPSVAFLVIAGSAVPYLREHRFLVSWGMLVWYSLAAAFVVGSLVRRWAALLPRVVFVVALVSLVVAVITESSYPAAYSHFARLFAAKIEHFNVKPVNPAKLSYEARILWTPALHSATSRFQGKYPTANFETLLVLGLAPFVLVARSLFRGSAAEGEKMLLFCLVAFFFLYILFVRMEVFLVFYLSCLIGLGARHWPELFQKRGARTVALSVWSFVVLVGVASEAYSYSTFEKIYRAADTGSPYLANRYLVNWLRKNTQKDAVVLASFTLEPTIFADAERAIVLHPKFESKGMREKVREYLESLFSENEKDFHDFCMKNRVNYFVLHPGAFVGPEAEDWIYSPRYMVDRAERYPQYATLAMLFNPERLQYFKKMTDIAIVGDPFRFFYRVFQVVSLGDIETAEQHVRNARMSLDRFQSEGEEQALRHAEADLLRAVDLFPGCDDAHSVLATVYTLQGERNKAKQAIDRYKQILEDRQP